eukprot:TRINITY_DN20979_c0_g1_i1.p6 TRINITY_DN20979_c0_g1~~TRINITY_DN20979_c0_g1_i1.p6  ORF type:complete len:131 (-),score=42.01 TRINITY_DN20979_c0_g1_i1:1731-2069(-)
MVLESSKSAMLAAGLFLLVALLLPLNGELFRSSEKLTVLAGVLSSSMTFFLLIVVGNFFANVTWLTLIPCVILSCGIAGLVHRVCITVCLLSSIAVVLYMNFMSKRVKKAAR